ncbi:hypothetical protein SAMN02799624_02300 [Paenibacillus sp. UNC496MF]|uniref:hypothetical protein n=1 Tax=Paenibacillus sp. UNC496MF TaxID=1502753 RepID=UPI0008DF3A17|nr:hypothetical protein [Paenibacillus sp. UNC496MF]SFI81075.1 hypothetical protein SAMN02799624_02300 [Paenibacillus sp. UNC496MF]
MNPKLLILPLPSALRITLTAGRGWPLHSKAASVYGNVPGGQASGSDPAENDGAAPFAASAPVGDTGAAR